MAKGNGNLLLTIEGLEISHIPETKREKAVLEFYKMKTKAERHQDRFFALKSVYSHVFSYGSFYPNFCNMTWAEFQSYQSLKGISQRVFDLMQGFCQNPNACNVDDEDTFADKDEPRAHSGYSNLLEYPVFVGDSAAWEKWHREWYKMHPMDIDWDNAANYWFPRQDLILEILKRELLKRFMEDGNEVECAMEMLENIEEKNVVHEFHRQVMARQGNNLEAYASKIGGEICRCNYYTYEDKLSDLERQYAKSLREIYSIVNKNGNLQFISIDFGHGMFEFHDDNGKHQGEFRFDGCTSNKGASADHDLKCLEHWRKKRG